jgi:hypothetical protein
VTLAERLIERDPACQVDPNIVRNLTDRFSPDTLIQAAVDRLCKNDSDFTTILTDLLYQTPREHLDSSEWVIFGKALDYAGMTALSREERRSFLGIMDRYWPGTSASALAEVISQVVNTVASPSTILSFNAEPLLLALSSAYLAERYADDTTGNTGGESRKFFDRITHSISMRAANRIPYVFCHGLLPVPVARRRRSTSAMDKLVFSESIYLQLANNAFSWQSSAFIDACTRNTIVFVGVSLSDPNMRRWLSWIHANRIHELTVRNKSVGPSTTHFWIHKAPRSAAECTWIESAVAHLGVRLVWLRDWSELGPTLKLMLDI